MQDSENIKAGIARFISRQARLPELKYDDEIFSRGFVNSLLAVQLVAFIEKEYNLTVEDEDLDSDNFRTIETIAALVERKNGSAQGVGQ